MPRPPKNQPLALIDGREVHATLKLRAGIYAVQFPDPNRMGKYREVSTRERHPLGAWAKAREIIESAYANTEAPRPAGPVTWEEVVALLPEMPGLLRPRAVEPYVGAISNLRKYVETSGPFDVTPEKAKRFRVVYEAQPFTKGKPKRVKTGEPIPPKGYTRKPKTVENAIRRLSGLWEKLLAHTPTPMARTNPWVGVKRPVVTEGEPVTADEKEWTHFFGWLEAKGWELMSVFLQVKAPAGCRTNDLCHVKAVQWDRRTRLLAINPDEDKTYQQRTIPIPPDLAGRLDAVAGAEFLWDRYRRFVTVAGQAEGEGRVQPEAAVLGGAARVRGLRARTPRPDEVDAARPARPGDHPHGRTYAIYRRDGGGTPRLGGDGAAVLSRPAEGISAEGVAEADGGRSASQTKQGKR